MLIDNTETYTGAIFTLVIATGTFNAAEFHVEEFTRSSAQILNKGRTFF